MSCSRIALGIRRRRRRSQRKQHLCSLLMHCSLRSLRLALVSRRLPHSLAGSLARPGQRRASLAPCGGARLPTLAALCLSRGLPYGLRMLRKMLLFDADWVEYGGRFL